MQLENTIQIDSGFRSPIGVGSSLELPTELAKKDLSFYITEYKGDEKISEQFINKREFMGKLAEDTAMNYCYFKILTNQETNQMQYGIAISFDNGGSWAVNILPKISAEENANATYNMTSYSSGFLTSDANNSYVIERMMFGEYRGIVYVLAE